MTREEAIKKVRWGLLGLVIDKDVRDAFETLIPELAESEDERVKKELIEFIKSLLCNDAFDRYKLGSWITWLEKQKPLSTEETELNSIAFLEQMGYTCIPPKKEHQNNSDAPKNALGGALNSPLDKDKNLDDIAQDYVEAVKEYNPEPTWNLMLTAVCYGYHYREQEEHSMSAEEEWSEEDEEAIKDAIKLLEAYYTDAIEDYCPHNAETLKKLINVLKSLRPQPKVEWSEEDESRLDHAITTLAENVKRGSAREDFEFLASLPRRFNLQPNRWKPSDVCYGAKGDPDPAGVWKPSEEQMEALRVTINFMPDTFKPRCTLITLQNGLEKLM